jgi:hypothetical protein
MRIQPDSTAGHCRISGDRIPFDITLEGLDASQLHALLHGGNDQVDWLQLASENGITADNPGSKQQSEPGQPITHDLEDGRFETTSGGPGRVIVEAHHEPPVNLLPQSLHLLLAQQLARSGILTLHAAAILTPNGGILVIGPRGGGKSVLTLSALAAGYGVISDDWILLGRNAEEEIQVERLRPFMMLRQSWAADQLRTRLPKLATRALNNRPKQLIRLPENTKRFPIGSPINQIWLLNRPRSARGQQTRLAPASQSTALARVVEANMPLLFTKAFPAEHNALMHTIKALLKNAPAFEVESGTDIVEEPRDGWTRLLAIETNRLPKP